MKRYHILEADGLEELQLAMNELYEQDREFVLQQLLATTLDGTGHGRPIVYTAVMVREAAE